MKHSSYSTTLAIVAVALILSLAAFGKAQNREKFVISAKAGGVNAISGRAEVRSKYGDEWQLLSITDNLKTGDVIKTGADGRIEMLLNPGSYLRIAEDSEFELTDDSLENLEVRLNKGTAIVEATGADGTELMINISTPHARMAIVKRGLYRVNVVPGDATELIVRKGRVLLDHSQTKVNSGNKVIFTSNTFSVAKLGKPDKQKDSLENWSKQRAETLALANRRIPGREANLFLASLNPWSYQFSFRSAGVWFFNPGIRCFTFLPFSFGWGSPYGGAYSGIWNYGGYHCCGWNPYHGPVPVGSTGGSSSGSGGGWGPRGGSGSGSGSGTGTTAGSGASSPAPAPRSPAPVRQSPVRQPDDSPRGRSLPSRPLPPI
jgi:hypothetical protein